MTRHPQAGLTLIEIMISMAVASIVMAAAMGAVLAQQRTSVAGARLRESQAQARGALSLIEHDLRLAGYGIDPALALDFNILGCPTPGGPYGAGCVRDRRDGTDEIAILYRDPHYWGKQLNPAVALPQGKAWRVTAAAVSSGAATVTLASVKKGLLLPKGQILQLVCAGGARHAYVTLPSAIDTRAAGASADKTIVFPAATDKNPTHQPATLADGCFAGGGARAFLVVRHRYYVRTFAQPGDPQGTPYLMLDTGTDTNGDGAVNDSDHVPASEGVEDLQLAYERPVSRTEVARVGDGAAALTLCGMPERRLGAGSCTADLRYVEWTSSSDAANVEGWSYLGLGRESPARTAPHVANITNVHVALTVRAASRDAGRTGTPPPVHFNRDPATLPAAGGYQRSAFVTSVAPLNLLSVAMSYL